jgi:hypothetical protein
MILRLWRGWTEPDQSLPYEKLLLDRIAPAILDRRIPGLRELTVLRRDPRELDPARGSEILTVMTFDDLDAVAAFTGGSPSASVVPASARKVLARFDQHSQHYLSLATFPNKLTG